MKEAMARLLEGILACFYHVFSLLGAKDRIVCLSRQSDDAPVDFSLICTCMSGRYPDVDVVICAKAVRGFPRYALHMIKQVFYIATSRAVVLDSYCIAVSLLGRRIKAPVVQMWHAMGNMKKFGYSALDEPEGRSSATAHAFKMHEGYDMVLISSMSFADDFMEGFGITDPAVLREAPLPKTDLLVDARIRAQRREELLCRYSELRGKKNIVYCPTFRKVPAPNEEQAMMALLDAVDFTRYNLIYMRHPVSTQALDDPRVFQAFDAPCSMLYAADYAISDYSTVIYEAGLLDIPIFLYAYDWDTYSRKRGLNIDIAHEVPTLFTDDARKIAAAIEDDAFDHRTYQEFIRRNITLPEQGTCTQHVVDLIMNA